MGSFSSSPDERPLPPAHAATIIARLGATAEEKLRALLSATTTLLSQAWAAPLILTSQGPRFALASTDSPFNANEPFGIVPRLVRQETEGGSGIAPPASSDATATLDAPPESAEEDTPVSADSLDDEATGQNPDEIEDTNGVVAPRPIDPAKAAFLLVLQRAKEGDVKAFEEIFQLYHRRIYNAVYGMLSDPDDAQDVTQDVFMRLHDALPTLRADEAFSTYLYRIALNLCRDRARRKKRVRFQSIDTPRTDDDGDAEPMDFPDQARLPEETLTNEELQRRVREAVQTLSHDHKTVIVMHHFQGMEVNDIAGILGVPTGTVKSRLARGRDQLHRKLRGYLNV